jgi:ectoine hydroxylase-related dioxygenase (phytanoyl-CoA dioxygenase family)
MAPDNGAKSSDLDESEVTRIAMRITMTAFGELQSKSKTLTEVEIMREYIKMCPFVSVDSAAMHTALRSLEKQDIHLVHHSIAEHGNGVKTHVIEEQPKDIDQDIKTKSLDATRFHKLFLILGYLFRTMIFEFPMTILFGAYLAAVWTHRIHDLYLEPQMRALVWDEDRMIKEMTYYQRPCSVIDMTTFHGADLFLSPNASTEDAYNHQLKHGLTVFRSVLSDKTARDLRNYVRSKNFKLPEEMSIFVIENEKRYSFGLGTEEPAVTKAMMELASHERLKPALEKILGPDPALIEMTAITATYGAKDQYWHDDVVARASAIQFARSFGPSYSVFIQLQNTTKEMGATACCPGTHMCVGGNMEEYCEESGFQVLNEDGYWRAGDALLMNMNTVHRGAGHTLLGAEDRVMLILTFVPRPRTHAESRQMSQGITFSLRWDMWGHTLSDLAMADTRMAQPWATLRSLGLYKQKEASWGIDYVSGASMRIANEDNGFREDQLEHFMENGLGPLPKFLYGEIDVEKEGWREFYLATVVKCENFLKHANGVAIVFYSLLQLLLLILRIFSGKKYHAKRRLGWSLIRLLVTHGIVLCLYLAANRYVDQTQWARDIKAERRYTNPFGNFESEYDGPTTWPVRDDILIETRYKSRDLAMYNDFVMAHPGNIEWSDLLGATSQLYRNYQGLPSIFLDNLSEYMVDIMESQRRRFLYQDKDSHWVLMSREDTLDYTSKQLKLSSNHEFKHLHQWAEYIISDLQTGFTRNFTMTQKHVLPYFKELKNKLFQRHSSVSREGNSVRVTKSIRNRKSEPIPRAIFVRSHIKRKLSQKIGVKRTTLSYFNNTKPMDVSPADWIVEGDGVEGRVESPKRKFKWYFGIVQHITSSGWFTIQFSDGEHLVLPYHHVRPYDPLVQGEKIEYFIRGKYRTCEIVRIHENGDYLDLLMTKTGQRFYKVFKGLIRRANKKAIVEKRETKYY